MLIMSEPLIIFSQPRIMKLHVQVSVIVMSSTDFNFFNNIFYLT